MAMTEEVVASSMEEATTNPSGAATTSKKKKKKKKKGGAGNAAQNPHAQEGSSAGNEEAATVEKIVEPCDSSNDTSNTVQDEMAPSTAVQEIPEEIQEQKDSMEDPQDLNPAEEAPATSEERKLNSNKIVNEEEKSEANTKAIADDNLSNVARGENPEDSNTLSNKKSTNDDREDGVGESFQTNPVRDDAPKGGVSGRPSEEVSRTQNESDEEKKTIEEKVKETKVEGAPSVPPTSSAPVNYLADSAKAWSPVPVTPQKNKSVPIPAGTKFFTYEELKALRPESGVDMTCKESYLSDEEFEKIFKKDRATWNAQPAWRRLMQKKDVGLW